MARRRRVDQGKNFAFPAAMTGFGGATLIGGRLATSGRASAQAVSEIQGTKSPGRSVEREEAPADDGRGFS